MGASNKSFHNWLRWCRTRRFKVLLHYVRSYALSTWCKWLIPQNQNLGSTSQNKKWKGNFLGKSFWCILKITSPVFSHISKSSLNFGTRNNTVLLCSLYDTKWTQARTLVSAKCRNWPSNSVFNYLANSTKYSRAI